MLTLSSQSVGGGDKSHVMLGDLLMANAWTKEAGRVAGWRSRGDRGLPAPLVQLGEQSSSSVPGFPILPA